MTHTPANWWFAAAEDGFYVAGTGDVEMTKPIGQDQARLIAAAPDLLEAVHGLLACCGPQRDTETEEMYRERNALLQWHIERACEALAKATGETA